MKLSFFLIVTLVCLAPHALARTVSFEEHNALLKRGSVWHPVDVASVDILAGPPSENARKPGEELRCKFEELDPSNPILGHTPKFRCRTAAGALVQVKYDSNEGREVFAEVAGTRLFWALGFYAERIYSIKVVCANCPKDPWKSYDTPRAERVFEPATLNMRLKGEPVYVSETEGWNVDELDNVDEASGGSTPAQLDAFRLLMAFANHGDNTANQQKLLCAEGDKDCRHPLLLVSDLGGVFAGSNYSTSYRGWAKKTSLWKDAGKCVLDFKGTYDKFADPQISEAGRKFLADLLGKLSDKQIHDIFAAARYDLLGKLDFPVAEKGGKSHQVTIDDWVDLFKKKRQQILDARCPS